SEARDQLMAAMDILRTDPGPDTVRALEQMAALEVFGGSPDADRLTTEALTLGQALGVDVSQMCALLEIRAIYLEFTDRRTETIAYLRESIRLATEAGDTFAMGAGLLNLSEGLSDWAAKAAAARTAAGHLRRVGNRDFLGYAVGNAARALVALGDWDGADAETAQAIASDGLAENGQVTLQRAELAALRGDTPAVAAMLVDMQDLARSEEPQDQASISLVRAFAAAASGQLQNALRHAREVIAHADVLGTGAGLPWAWATAARAAFELEETHTVRELVALADSFPPGLLPPMLRAERDLALARLAAATGDPAAEPQFASAISGLRELSTPYHLAHGLLDQAAYLTGLDDAAAAALAIDEAEAIGRRLRCQPLLDRAAAMASAEGIRA
ncbi:MAG: hypothetical protein WAK82_33890, partial [Streptosporangiaceae bacterium]